MNTKDLFLIAFRNLSAGRQMVKKLVFGMLFVIMLLLCTIMIVYSYFKYKEGFNEKYAADCYYYKMVSLEEITQDTLNELLAEKENLKTHYHAQEAAVLGQLKVRKTQQQPVAKNTYLMIDNVTYAATNYYSYQRKMYQNIQWESSPIEMNLYRKGMQVFPDKMLSAYPKEKEPCLLGTYPDLPGELMLDRYLLEVYGIEQIDENLLGKKISIYCLDENEEIYLLEDYVLSGIFQGDLLTLRESVSTKEPHWEHIYVNLLEGDRGKFRLAEGSIRIYFENYADYVENYDEKNRILSLNVTGIYEEANSVRLTGMGMQYCLLYWIMDSVGRLLLGIVLLIGLVITFSILYIFQFYRKRNEHYDTMLQNIGMEKHDRERIGRIEMATMLAIATLLGGYLSALFLLIFHAVTKQVLDFSIVIDGKILVMAVLGAWGYFGVCFAAVMKR